MPSTITIRLLVLFVSAHALNAASQTQPLSQLGAVALTHARIIDGTGASGKEDQTLIIEGGKIALVGNAGDVEIPSGARMIDVRGRTVLPGLVMLHEHLAYGPVVSQTDEFAGVLEPQPFSAPRLFLAFGVTTIRTAGTAHPYVDPNLKRQVDGGQVPGPEMFLTGPVLNGPGSRFLDEKVVRSPEEARRAVRYWAAEGFTSMKAYDGLPKDALAATIEEAHALKLPVTAHLGATVSCREAAELGIDNLEHGFGPCTGKTSDGLGNDPEGPRARALVQLLVDKRVVLTPTPRNPNRSLTDSQIDLLHPSIREKYLRARQSGPAGAADTSRTQSPSTRMVPRLLVAFVKAGGHLVLGSDAGCCHYAHFAGVANHDALIELAQIGFSPLEAIRIATVNGAAFLGISNRTGSIAIGKEADLFAVRGDPSVRIEDIDQVETVFSNGVQYDPQELLAQVKGIVGWR